MEMAILREMHEGKEIAEISWVPTNTKIADSTKKGVPSFKILGFMSEPIESSVVTLSYFLLQNLCPTEIKRKREKNC